MNLAPLGKAEATKLIEKALLEQAGVVLARLDGQRASVTYVDALAIAPAKQQLRTAGVGCIGTAYGVLSWCSGAVTQGAACGSHRRLERLARRALSQGR